ncbi:hypothetical protein DFH27DRAFT_140510 [Peziza echinospora]|nr:hypothetical protein DFH27DRAFT_140510 [Peziza echinospora]
MARSERRSGRITRAREFHNEILGRRPPGPRSTTSTPNRSRSRGEGHRVAYYSTLTDIISIRKPRLPKSRRRHSEPTCSLLANTPKYFWNPGPPPPPPPSPGGGAEANLIEVKFGGSPTPGTEAGGKKLREVGGSSGSSQQKEVEGSGGASFNTNPGLRWLNGALAVASLRSRLHSYSLARCHESADQHQRSRTVLTLGNPEISVSEPDNLKRYNVYGGEKIGGKGNHWYRASVQSWRSGGSRQRDTLSLPSSPVLRAMEIETAQFTLPVVWLMESKGSTGSSQAWSRVSKPVKKPRAQSGNNVDAGISQWLEKLEVSEDNNLLLPASPPDDDSLSQNAIAEAGHSSPSDFNLSSEELLPSDISKDKGKAKEGASMQQTVDLKASLPSPPVPEAHSDGIEICNPLSPLESENVATKNIIVQEAIKKTPTEGSIEQNTVQQADNLASNVQSNPVAQPGTTHGSAACSNMPLYLPMTSNNHPGHFPRPSGTVEGGDDERFIPSGKYMSAEVAQIQPDEVEDNMEASERPIPGSWRPLITYHNTTKYIRWTTPTKGGRCLPTDLDRMMNQRAISTISIPKQIEKRADLEEMSFWQKALWRFRLGPKLLKAEFAREKVKWERNTFLSECGEFIVVHEYPVYSDNEGWSTGAEKSLHQVTRENGKIIVFRTFAKVRVLYEDLIEDKSDPSDPGPGGSSEPSDGAVTQENNRSDSDQGSEYSEESIYSDYSIDLFDEPTVIVNHPLQSLWASEPQIVAQWEFPRDQRVTHVKVSMDIGRASDERV